MKTFGKVMRILTAIAAVIGIVYVVATYGDRIVAWANDLLNRLFDKRTRFFDIDEQMETAEDVEVVAPDAEVAPAE